MFDCDVHLLGLGVERNLWKKLYRAFNLANPEQVEIRLEMVSN
jgi:hypothetical protein